MSMNPLRPNLSRNGPLKPPLSVSNVNQNIDKRRLSVQKRMSKETGNDDFYQPPDKRRKTDEKVTPKFERSDDWDDDDFTQDQLENIDEMVFMSQQVVPQRQVDGNHNTKKVETIASAPSSVRVLGKGTNRSQSAGDVRANVQGLSPVHPSSKQSGQQSQRKVTTTTTATGGGARLQATPTAGASGHGLSPSMPSSATCNTKEIDQLRSELDYYKKEVKKAKEGLQSKEGHIKILKSKLDEKEKELHNQQQSRLAQLEQAKHERSEREKTLQKEMERLKAQLQFKEQEIVELQGTCRRLEQRSHGSTGNSDSPRRQASPRRPVPVSPRRSVRNSPRAVNKMKEKSTPGSEGKGFPNKTTFMAEERRPSMRKVLSTTPEPSLSKTGVVSKPAEPQKEAVADLSRRVVKMKLDVTSINGMTPNATLVSKIVAENPNRPGGGRPRGEGLINLLHAPPLPREISGVKLRHQDETFTHSSHNRLMKLLKSKGSPKAPKKKIVIPQIVTPENYHLAVTGLTLMLETDQDDFDHHRASSVVSATSEHAVLILPVLDRYLVSYTLVLEKSLDLSAISATDTVGNSLTPAVGSLDTLTSSLRSLLLRGANVANLVENSAINTLKVLYNLVRYSSHVCNALICDTYSDIEAKKPTNRKRKTKDGAGNSDMTGIANGVQVGGISTNQGAETSTNGKLPAATRTSSMNPQPSTSKQALNTQSAKGNGDKAVARPKGKASSSRSDKIASIVSRKLQIRRCLAKMANPCLPNNDPAKVEVVLLALKTLAIMADSCKTQDQFDRFGPLLTRDVLLNCLTESNKLPKPGYYLVVGTALDLLISLAKNIKLTKQMCTSDEETCLMVAVYNLHQIVEGMPDQALKSRITSKFVSFLSAISCRHRQNVNLLFDKNCKCSLEVVKSVIVTLHEELLRWRQNSSRVSTETLRQGATLLHALASQDKLFKKHKETVLQYYKELLSGLVKVITHAKHITPNADSKDREMAALHVRELWDFDVDYVDSREYAVSKKSTHKRSSEPMEHD